MDEPEPRWGRPEQSDVFPDEDVRADVSLATLSVKAESRLARRFLLEPLPIIAKHLSDLGVTKDWTLSLERVNGHVPLSGPRKIVAIITAFAATTHVHVVVLRLEDEAKA